LGHGGNASEKNRPDTQVPEGQAHRIKSKPFRHDILHMGGGENTMFSSLYQLAGALVARVQREEGQSMAEYGILIAVIGVVVLVAAALLGTSISSVFNSLATHI
jgi:pilus assembly protein Flp/PilA